MKVACTRQKAYDHSPSLTSGVLASHDRRPPSARTAMARIMSAHPTVISSLEKPPTSRAARVPPKRVGTTVTISTITPTAPSDAHTGTRGRHPHRTAQASAMPITNSDRRTSGSGSCATIDSGATIAIARNANPALTTKSANTRAPRTRHRCMARPIHGCSMQNSASTERVQSAGLPAKITTGSRDQACSSRIDTRITTTSTGLTQL